MHCNNLTTNSIKVRSHFVESFKVLQIVKIRRKIEEPWLFEEIKTHVWNSKYKALN
jgi:hypothetical protein